MAKYEPRHITVVEGIVTYISLGWAYVMFTNEFIFKNSENFSKMESIVQKEWAVGLVCLILAVIKIYGMVMKMRRVRWIGLILSTIFWVIVSATFLLSAEEFELNTGFIVYSGIAVMCLWTSKEVISYDRTNERSTGDTSAAIDKGLKRLQEGHERRNPRDGQ